MSTPVMHKKKKFGTGTIWTVLAWILGLGFFFEGGEVDEDEKVRAARATLKEGGQLCFQLCRLKSVGEICLYYPVFGVAQIRGSH